MSILAENASGWIISHEKYFDRIEIKQQILSNSSESQSANDNIENGTNETVKVVKLNPNLFEMKDPFVKKQIVDSDNDDGKLSSTSKNLKNLCKSLIELGKRLKFFDTADCAKTSICMDNDLQISDLSSPKIFEIQKDFDEKLDKITPETITDMDKLSTLHMKKSNRLARETASEFFDLVKDLNLAENKFSGGNYGPSAIVHKVSNHDFVFPKDTKFYCQNVEDLQAQLNGQKFDLIVMDPPWWNKYIRRRKRKQAEAGYQLLENFKIEQLPIEEICEDNAIVVVWCTNSKCHQKQLVEVIFPKWGIELITIWRWIKVTKSGVPVCPFNAENKKQPYESIIIGRKKCKSLETNFDADFQSSRVILSVPSSINSHKPPLIDVILKFFGLELTNERQSPKCLEIFARYLIPGFTSFGNEVIKLQHSWLYVDAD